MAIVASNGLTISNVSDGNITHTAYAYSQDGTDGFTTVYPNLNLLTDTRLFSDGKTASASKKGQVVVNGNATITSLAGCNYVTFTSQGSQNQDWFRVYLIPDTGAPLMDKSEVLPNTKYTFSFYAKGSGEHIIFPFNSWTSAPASGSLRINLTSEWKLYTFTVTSMATIPTKNVQFFLRSSIAGSVISVTKPKVELGSIATPWMTSQSEATTSDYPKYRGEYSDLLTIQSANPSDYTWSMIRGNDGKDGTTGQRGEKGDPTGVTKSATEPENKFIGMIWYVDSDTDVPSANMEVGTAAQSHGQYTWTGTKWSLYMLRSVNLMVDNGFIKNTMIADATIESAKIKNLNADKIIASSLAAISADLGAITSAIIKVMADVMVNTTKATKKFGMLFTKKGLLSTGPSYSSTGQVSDTKMSAASLTQGELRFIDTDYSEDLEAVQNNGISSANHGFIRFTSNTDGDMLEITSSGKIILNGVTSQPTPWIQMASANYLYKYMFSRVYIAYATRGTSASYIQFGHLPVECRPGSDKWLVCVATTASTGNDRHIQIRASDGAVILWGPLNGQDYIGEVSFTL